MLQQDFDQGRVEIRLARRHQGEAIRKALDHGGPQLQLLRIAQIRNDYGSLDAHFAQELDVTPEERKQLQALYLEPAPLMTKNSAQL